MVDIDAKFRADNTVLHRGASLGNSRIVKMLLEAGADVDAPNILGCYPLHEAISSNNVSILKILIDNGAKLNVMSQEQRTPLHKAIVTRNEAIVKYLLKIGANVNTRDVSGETPLHTAVQPRVIYTDFNDRSRVMAPSAQFLTILLKAGANANAISTSVLTPLTHLMGLVRENFIKEEFLPTVEKCVRLLIEFTDVNLLNRRGKNLLSLFFETSVCLLRRVEVFVNIIAEFIAKLRAMGIRVNQDLYNVLLRKCKNK